jgi:hypothetical protein
MGVIFRKFKTKFRYALKPVFAMLVHKQKEMDRREWVAMVMKIRNSVQGNPSEYLGTDLPDKDLLNDVLEELFHEFQRERSSQSVSASRLFNYFGE